MEKPLEKDFTSKEEFAKAMLAYNKLNPVDSKKLSKFDAPKVVELSGAITQISENAIKGTNGAFRVATMQSGDRFVVSETLFESNKSLLQLGNVIDVKCEQRIANKTGYIDSKGNEQPHGKDGLGFISASFEPEFLKGLSKSNKEVATRQAEIDGAFSSAVEALSNASEKDKAIVATMFKVNVEFSR